MELREVRAMQSTESFVEDLYRKYFNELELYALAFVKKHDDAQVVVQETFRIAWQKVDELRNSPNPQKWLKHVVRNVSQNMLRHRKRQMDLFISLEDLSYEIAAPEDSIREDEFLKMCYQLLSEKDLPLFKHIVSEGLTYAAAAKKEGISLWSCYKRMERIEKKIRDTILKE